jgi:coenzyme F420-0:L-glutamate ligase/coenzyme F420-1:gamma-L-glutamate ligase
MPEILHVIKTRRSIRKYSPRKVTKKTLNEIFEAARWAPSAHNAQPWRFVVLTESSAKMVLADAMAKAWIKDLAKKDTSAEIAEKLAKRSIRRFAKAPIIVVACLTLLDMPKPLDEEGRKIERDLAIQSLGASIQNMLLAAHSRGLGACWFCAPIFCKDEVREVLRLPADFEPQALITLGYAVEKPEAPPRKLLQDILRPYPRSENSRRTE